MKTQPSLEPNCGYAVHSFLRVQGTVETPAPFFVKFDPELMTITVRMQANMADVYTPEDIFRRYNLEIVYLAVNQDLLAWAEPSSNDSSEVASLETAKTYLN